MIWSHSTILTVDPALSHNLIEGGEMNLRVFRAGVCSCVELALSPFLYFFQRAHPKYTQAPAMQARKTLFIPNRTALLCYFVMSIMWI